MEKVPEPYINPELEVKKIDLERRLEEIFNNKIEAQQKINNFEEELEKTKNILESLEKKEQELNQELNELEESGSKAVREGSM